MKPDDNPYSSPSTTSRPPPSLSLAERLGLRGFLVGAGTYVIGASIPFLIILVLRSYGLLGAATQFLIVSGLLLIAVGVTIGLMFADFVQGIDRERPAMAVVRAILYFVLLQAILIAVAVIALVVGIAVGWIDPLPNQA